MELKLSSLLVNGEFWSKIEGARGASLVDGFAAMVSSTAALFKAFER